MTEGLKIQKTIRLKKWNVTPLLLRGSKFYFFTDLYCARIGINDRFALPAKEGGKERAFRPIRVQYKRAELDLRSTKNSTIFNLIFRPNFIKSIFI